MTNSKPTKPLPTVKLRPIGPTDLLLARQAAQSLYKGQDLPRMLERYTQYLYRRIFVEKSTWGWTAEVDGQAVGLLILSLETHPYEIPELYAYGELMYVKKAYRGVGISRQLATLGQEWAVENKIGRIKMIARPSNENYNDMLKTFGTQEIGAFYEWINQAL
jgi:GNAT superfamily N-acetyltransferase